MQARVRSKPVEDWNLLSSRSKRTQSALGGAGGLLWLCGLREARRPPRRSRCGEGVTGRRGSGWLLAGVGSLPASHVTRGGDGPTAVRFCLAALVLFLVLPLATSSILRQTPKLPLIHIQRELGGWNCPSCSQGAGKRN